MWTSQAKAAGGPGVVFWGLVIVAAPKVQGCERGRRKAGSDANFPRFGSETSKAEPRSG